MPSRCEAAAIRSCSIPGSRAWSRTRRSGTCARPTPSSRIRSPSELAAPGRQLGSELLTIGDDGSVVGLRGTLPFDDEGTPPSNTLLVQHGVVVGRLHSRETAARFGERPTGNARALSFRHVPLVRLTNTYVANGTGTFADLIRDVKLGVYACDAVGSRHRGDSYSFTAGHGYMIRDGALAEPVKGVVLVGFVTEILGAVDRVAGDFHWHESGGGCGKGGQSPLPVAEGAPHSACAMPRCGGRHRDHADCSTPRARGCRWPMRSPRPTRRSRSGCAMAR